MSERVRVLEAGGLVPPGGDLPSDLPVDTVDARGYRHPALPDRVVVRLVADVIARGVDTEMGLLGFQLAEHHDDIALRRRQALGFPGRALLEDPERARFALDVMKEFKAQAKRIASKPGHAREGFEEIAQKLERTVPAFLPSYWEEVARAFAGAGNLSYAASSFDKARTAEREFGLAVDEEIRGDAFLEFALLGALTVKSLQTYGKELQKSVGADSAYERMFSLASRRTLGGMPPWASMLKDLRGLAKSAKRDVDAEERRLLTELLPASSMVRAPRSFWEETRGSLTALASSDPAIRARLLDLFPNAGSRYSWRDDEGFSDAWMDVLAETGALSVLWDASAPPESIPTGGRAAWLGRLQDWANGGNGWILQIVRRSADVLRADGAPIPVATGGWRRPFDLDLLDLLLELDLPWTLEAGGLRVELDAWAQWQPAPERHGFEAEIRPRDPVRAAAEPTVAARLVAAIDDAFGSEGFEAVAARMSGLRELRRSWLAERVGDLTRSGLGLSMHAVGRLEDATRAGHFAEFPESFEALQAADAAVALQRTLRAGIPDELGWPAFDEALRAVAPADDDDVLCIVQWPHLIFGNERKIVVLGPSGIELVHDVKLGKGEEPSSAFWVGGELYVATQVWRSGLERKAYWSGAPSDVFAIEEIDHGRWSAPLERADAIVVGTRTFTRRDRVGIVSGQPQCHDHERTWIWHEGELREQDRATGKIGPKGAPGFLADVVDRTGPYGWAYLPVPAPWAATSPLGVVDGLFGCKQVTPVAREVDEDALDEDSEEVEPTGQTVLETLAGARFVGALRLGSDTYLPTRLMRWPGSDAWRAVAPEGYRWRRRHDFGFYVGDPELAVCAIAHGDDLRMAARLLPPIDFWHALTPRDEPGSRALRGVSVEACRALVDAAAGEATGLPEAIRAALPAVSDAALIEGISLIAKLAADLERRVLELRTARAGGTAGERVEHEVQDQIVGEALSNLRHYWSWGGSYVSAEVRTLGAWLARGEGVDIKESRLEPRDWIGFVRGIAACAARPGLAESARAALLDLLARWRDSGLCDPGAFRIGKLRLDRLPAWVPTQTDEGVTTPVSDFRAEVGGRRLWVHDCDTDDEGPWDAHFLEWSQDGSFGDLEGATVTAARVARIAGDREWLDAFLAMAHERGPWSVAPETVAAVADRTGQSAAEALVALVGFPKELDKELREAHGLKALAAKGAAGAFGDWSAARKLGLLAAWMGEDPATPWSLDTAEGRERWTAVWLEQIGRVLPIDPELLAQADKELGRDGASRLRALAAVHSWEELRHDQVWAVDEDGDITSEPASEGVSGFSPDLATDLCGLLTWVASRTPVGDPLRANVPVAWRLACERARAPGLLIDGGSWYLGEEKSRERKAGEAWFDALGGEVVTRTDEDGDVSARVRTAGPITASHNGWRVQVVLRVNALDPHARELALTFAKASESDLDELGALEALQGAELRELCERIEHSPLPAGAWEQDPSRSAPELVAAVQARFGLGPEAAALYLQTLALLDPTKKNAMLWNGWTAKTYAAAAAELVGKRLVVEGKRARAGREHFLPGGWIEEKKLLPWEEWKRPLYGWADDRFPLGGPVALLPVHRLFERAWARVVAGDAPRFEEVRR